MPLRRRLTVPGVLTGLCLSASLGHAAQMPASIGVDDSLARAHVVLVRDKGGAVAAGAIMGGALGVILGSQLGQAAPQREREDIVEEDVVEEEPLRRTVVRRPAPVRRVIEVEEEEPAPVIVEEEECVVKRTKIYDPNSGRTEFRKERRCD